MIPALLTALLSGCSQTIKASNFCDLSQNLKFEDQSVVDYLIEYDKKLLRGVVSHNEKRKALCKS